MSNKSAEAFLHQIESGKRTTDAMRVYNYILNDYPWGRTFSDIKRSLEMPHQTCSARLAELCDMGVIFELPDGSFGITPSDKVGEYAAMREDARYKKWRKLGEKNGWFNQLRIV